MFHNNQQRGYSSRSTSRHRPRNVPINPSEIAKYINHIDTGRIDLRTLRNSIFQNVDPMSSVKFQALWKMLSESKDNFILSDPLRDPQSLSGNETIWVRTVLGLCRTHCRRGKDGRNRACDGDCGALHVCRTYLLRSENACPFNSKKKKCMFGHRFFTDHNVELLRAHNLFTFDETELQRLFRRRPSRSASTLPQLCIYYNKADGKKCSRDSCKSLHICSDFIMQCCEGNCSRNHKLSTPQVLRILDLFAVDNSWTPEMLLEDLRHFMTARHINNTSSCDSNDGSDISEFSESGFPFQFSESEAQAGKPPSYTSAVNCANDNASIGQVPSCEGCDDLKRVISRMQLTMSYLTTQVTHLRTEVNNLNSRMSAMDGLASQEYENTEDTLPKNATISSSGEREAKFVRSQTISGYTGVPPISSQFEKKLVISNSD